MTALRILSIKSAFYTPVILTAIRFLPEAGVQTELIYRTNHNPSKMMRDGTLDFSQHAPSAAMVDRANGIDDTPIHIASINERDGFLLIGREPDANFTWSKLQGRTVVPASFAVQPEACLRFALHRQGVDASKVNLVEGLDGMAAAAAAFAQGTGDYVHLQDPAARMLVKQGKGHLVAMFGDAIGPIAFSSVATSQAMIKERPDTVRSFMMAYSQARQWMAGATAREISEAVAGEFDTIDSDVLHDAIDGYKSLGTWTAKTAITRSAFDTALDMMNLSSSLTGVADRYPYEQCCNDEFANEVDGNTR